MASPFLLIRADPELAGLQLLGLPLLRRAVLSAVRAGIDRVVVAAPEPREMEALLQGTPAAVVPAGERVEAPPSARLILLEGGILPDTRWLKTLAETPPGAEPPPAGPKDRFLLASAGDARKAEDWLLARLVKDSESFLSKNFERRISLAVSRRLAWTPVTPNAVTFVSLSIGLAGASLFLSAEAARQAAGSLLLIVHSAVDGCDGELARLKFQESRLGMILDLWGDNVVHTVLFACMGIGWSRAAGAAWPLAVAALAAAGTLTTALVVYRQSVRWAAKGVPSFDSVVRSRDSRLSRLLDSLGNRDFFYLILLLSLFGAAHWFLVPVAVGSPLFAAALLFLARGERA